MRSKHVREHKASLPSATNRLHNVVAAPHHPLPGLHQPRHRPGPPHPTTTTSPECTGCQRCSSWTSTPTVSLSSSKSCRRKCEHCSCHIRVYSERMQARACVGPKSVRWGSCVRKHAESGLTATPKDGRAARSIALAPIDPAARGLLAPARMRADVSTWPSTKLWDRAMRGWAASRARVRGS